MGAGRAVVGVRLSLDVLGVVGHLPVPTRFLAVRLALDAASRSSSPRMGPTGRLLVLVPELARSPYEVPLDELGSGMAEGIIEKKKIDKEK